MSIELPADVHALRANVARVCLIDSYRQTFSEEPPDYVMSDSRQIRRAEREWYVHYEFQIALLATAAQQALDYLDQQGYQAAIVGFTSSVITQPQLGGFMHANPYLTELVANTLRNADSFRKLLELFAQLPRASS